MLDRFGRLQEKADRVMGRNKYIRDEKRRKPADTLTKGSV